jgi:DNA polymerase-1
MAPSSAPPTLVLVDGFSLAYRMYFALERTQMATATGQPTWALFGFFNAFFQLLKAHQPQAVAFVFDAGRETFRTELYPEYKAQRSAMPEPMRAQLNALFAGIEALGLPLFQEPHVEADDVIGTLATRMQVEHPDWQVAILTGDQDSFQLIDEQEKVTVWLPGRGPKEALQPYHSADVVAKWGITPAQVVDFKALKGDASDNIPGVAGIGDKTAAKLLNQYGTLEGIYQHLEQITPAGVQQKLTLGKAQAFLSQQLARIVCNVPVAFDLTACQLQPKAQRSQALATFFETHEFKAFQRQLPQLEACLSGQTPTIPLPQEPTEELSTDPTALAPVEVPFAIASSVEDVAAFLAKAKGHGVLAIDLETTGLDVKTAQPVGIALTTGPSFVVQATPTANVLQLAPYPATLPRLVPQPQLGLLQTLYIPLGHGAYAPKAQQSLLLEALPSAEPVAAAPPEPQNLPWEAVKAVLAPCLADTTLYKLVHNLKYEVNVLHHWGVPLQGPIMDSMLASYVLNAEGKHGLKLLAEQYLNLPMAPIETLIGKGKQQVCFSQVPVAQAAPYAARDTYATWCLTHMLLSALDEPRLALLYELELPVAHVLARMEDTGIGLNVKQLQAFSQQLHGELHTLEARIYELAGESFNLNSPKQVGDVLYGKLGLATGKKTSSKTAFSTDAKTLEALADEHEVVRQLLEYRQLFKLKSTYVDALPTMVHPQTGRIHTHFNQAVTATGRLSSSEPNLQNIPVRTPLGQQLRQAFIPQAGWQLLSADYSQIELRLLAHLSEDEALIAAFNRGADIHQATAALVLGIPEAEVTKAQRYAAKAINFGIVYGQSAHGLSQQLGITRAEAATFIDQYFATYPRVRAFIEETKAKAHATGLSHTLFGRQRNLSKDLNSSLKPMREFAERASFNTPIQGSAADVMKLAMVRLQAALLAPKADGTPYQSRLLLQVHDELVLEVPPQEVAEVTALVRSAMELGQPLRVPLVVDVALGPNWLEQ